MVEPLAQRARLAPRSPSLFHESPDLQKPISMLTALLALLALVAISRGDQLDCYGATVSFVFFVPFDDATQFANHTRANLIQRTARPTLF